MFDNKNKKTIIIFISWTVAKAISRLISNKDHIRDEASQTPQRINEIAKLKLISKYKK